jgi:hypothetical protein
MGYDNLRLRTVKDLADSGYTSLAGPYRRSEEAMMDRVVADARRANKIVAFSGTTSAVEVWQKQA